MAAAVAATEGSPRHLVRHPKLPDERSCQQACELSAQAEGSSILPLRSFVPRLRTYAPVTGST
jgi:hypothetical protein